MKFLFKKYWIVLLLAICINVPLFILGTTKTDKSVTLKGDTTVVENFVQIDDPHPQKGSLSTIYVISLDHCTLLQTYMVGASKTSEVSDVPESYLHFSTAELNQMGRIQHESSINYALIQAYKEAKKVDDSIRLEAEFDYCQIDFYNAGSVFRIGDKIIAANGIDAKSNTAEFKDFMNSRLAVTKDGKTYDGIYLTSPGDQYTVLRGNQTLTLTCNGGDLIEAYDFYKINESTASPHYKINETNVGGPSGGLLQTLALYNCLIEKDITKGRRIAGTGTIDVNGTVGPIGGIQQKIYTAFDDDMDIFLCPAENYEEALIAYRKLPNQNMKLYRVETFAEALEVLDYE